MRKSAEPEVRVCVWGGAGGVNWATNGKLWLAGDFQIVVLVSALPGNLLEI